MAGVQTFKVQKAPTAAWLDACKRSCAISSFIPIAFMSLLTQLLHVFLGAPLSTTPITFILVHFFTQLFSSFRSTCPNHLNLPLCRINILYTINNKLCCKNTLFVYVVHCCFSKVVIVSSGFALNSRALRALDSGFALNLPLPKL